MTLLLLGSSILFNRGNAQQEIRLMVWNEEHLSYIYSTGLYVFQKGRKCRDIYVFADVDMI